MRIRHCVNIAVVCAAIGLVAFAWAAPAPPITLVVNPRISFAPTTLAIHVRVEPHADNRNICVVADGTIYRSSCWMLEGLNAPKTVLLYFRDLSAGEYEVIGVVTGVQNRQHVARQTVYVLSAENRREALFFLGIFKQTLKGI